MSLVSRIRMSPEKVLRDAGPCDRAPAVAKIRLQLAELGERKAALTTVLASATDRLRSREPGPMTAAEAGRIADGTFIDDQRTVAETTRDIARLDAAERALAAELDKAINTASGEISEQMLAADRENYRQIRAGIEQAIAGMRNANELRKAMRAAGYRPGYPLSENLFLTIDTEQLGAYVAGMPANYNV